MTKKHSKTDIQMIVFAALYNLLFTALGMMWIFTGLFDNAKKVIFCSEFVKTDLVSFSYLFFAGAVGGSAYCLRAIYMRLADAYPENDKMQNAEHDPTKIFNIKVWFFWYLYRPIQSGILAIVLICLFSQGILNIDSSNANDIKSIFFQFGVGFLIGFGTHEVINKIKDLIKNLFTTSKPADKTNVVSNDASLSKIEVDGKPLSGFAANQDTYTQVCDNAQIPVVKATTTNSQAKVDISNPSVVPGDVVITVTAPDGKTKKIYTVKFNKTV